MSNRLTIKGQVTVPKNVRDFLGLTAGSSAVEFFIDEDGSVRVVKAEAAKPRQVERRRNAVLPQHAVNHCDRVLALLSGCALAA